MAIQETAVCAADNLFSASQITPVDADSLTIAASQNLKRGALVDASGVVVGAPVTAQKASATLTFGMQPSANDTVTIGATTLTFVSSEPSSGEVAIGANIAATITNLIAALPAIVTGSAQGTNAVLIQAAAAGAAGNLIAISRSSTAIAVSSSTLVGGADAHFNLDVYAVLAEDCDTTSGAKSAPVYLTGDFNARALHVSTADGHASVADCKVNARKVGIFIKDTIAI